jgi:hypothetical protein
MATKKRQALDVELDEEEQALLSSLERGECASVEDLAEEKVKAKQLATNTLPELGIIH